MKFITIGQLQREFGLPFTTAERIVREQMALARQPYRRWETLALVLLVASLACMFAPDGSWVDHVGHLLRLVGTCAITVFLFLMQRRAQAPCLAAARAAAHPD